jgi:acyl dehydratase
MVKIGTVLQNLVKDEITHTQLVRYAGASGDFHPIHTVVPYAQKAGLNDVFAHGMLVMGFIGQAIGTWFSSADLVKFGVRFQKVTNLGDKITVKGMVIDETMDRWICEATAVNIDGEVKATAKFEIKKC